MKVVVPDELRELLASAPRNPNPDALSLFNLRIGTKVRYVFKNGAVITGSIASSPHQCGGGWTIGITYESGATNDWTLHGAGLIPARLVSGEYRWHPPGPEYQSSIRRLFHRLFGFRVDMEPDAVFFPSIPF